MKKFFVTMLMVLLTAPTFAQFGSGGFSLSEENLYYGIRFGVTSASLSGDIDSGSKVGMTLAGVVGFRVSYTAPLFLESGLYYTERGGKEKVTDATVSYNVLEVPLLIKYGVETQSDFILLPFIGPYFGYAIKTDHLNRANMGFKAGCGIEYRQLYLEAGRQFGVTDILDGDASVRSNAWFLNFGINF
jgi:hypothetical protein